MFLQYKILIPICFTLVALVSWNIHTRQFNNSKINLSFNEPPPSSAEIFPGDPEYYLDNLREQATIYDKNVYVLNQQPTIKISLTGILRTFTINTPYRTKLIIKNFISNISEEKFKTVQITTLNILFFILFLSIVIFITTPIDLRTKSQIPQNTFFLIVGFIIYSFAILFAYIYIFPPLSGIEAPSVNRYLSSFLLGWWILVICTLHEQESLHIPLINVKALSIISTALLILFLAVIPLTAYIHSPYSPEDSRRFEVSRISKAIKEVISREDKIYDIWQVDSFYGFSHYILKYNLTPITTNYYGWKLINSTSINYIEINEHDGSIEMSPNEWLKLLNDQEYTYVLISTSDNDFWVNYGSLFDEYQDENIPQLFSVSPTGLENIPIHVKY